LGFNTNSQTDLEWGIKMRLLFEIDKKDYDPNGAAFI
jgi:hypothetical protein